VQMIRVADGCSRCPALVANRRCIVHGYGSPLARIVFVGEAPGYRGGDLTGVPFTRDRSGVRLQKLLIALGLSDETDPRAERPTLRCFVTNIVRCNPPGNRTPSHIEVASCLPFLWQEMDLLQPRIVVPLGNVATQAIVSHYTGQSAPRITVAHTRLFAGKQVTIIPMRHPARISNADLERFQAAMADLLRSSLR
jgi:uracil-DNA glycosylase family 4